MLTSLYIWYYLFVPVILVDDLTFYLTWSIQLDCFLYSPAWYTWLCFEITRRNWKLITFQNKQNYFYVLTSVHRKQECLSWRENFSLKWKFDLFLFFFVLFFCFVCCVVLWFFFLHSGQTSPIKTIQITEPVRQYLMHIPLNLTRNQLDQRNKKKENKLNLCIFLFKSSNLHIILYGRICGLNNERLESWKRKLAGTAISNRPRQFPMKFISGSLSTTDWKIPIYWRHWLVLAQKNQTNPKHLFCSRFLNP